jgi:hypothetical protein
MIITGTSDKIQFKLDSTVTIQLPFTVDYNNYTSTAVSLVTNNGTSNDTTAVDLMQSPASGEQNELKYCSITNTDTTSATVTIQIYNGTNTIVVFRAVLASGELLQYQPEKGWEVIDSQGNKETTIWNAFNNTINGSLGWRHAGIASTITPASGQMFFISLGKAEKAHTSYDIMYNVTTQASSITFAEMAIFSAQRFNSDVALPMNTRGTVSTASVWNSTGIKKTNIPVSGITPGENVILGMVYSGSGLIFRSLGWGALDISDSTFGSMGTSANIRPSLMPFVYYFGYNAALMYINWQAN